MEWIIARWVTFAATLLLTGACVVGLALAPRLGRDTDTATTITRDAARLGARAIAALIPASALRLADQVMALRSPGDPLLDGIGILLSSTMWGTGFLWQCGAALSAGVGCVMAARSSRAALWWGVASVGALGLCVTPALQGHAIGSESFTAWAVGADVAHVLGASVWLGTLGVIGWLGVAVPNADGVVAPAQAATAELRLRALVPLVPGVALPGAALLVSSGVVTTVLHLQDVRDLWRADWGRFVLAKAAIVSVIVLLGACNWRRLGPRMAAGADTRALRKSLLTELLLALLVLLVTAVLVVTPLPGE